jgi:hypothetical protein
MLGTFKLEWDQLGALDRLSYPLFHGALVIVVYKRNFLHWACRSYPI